MSTSDLSPSLSSALDFVAIASFTAMGLRLADVTNELHARALQSLAPSFRRLAWHSITGSEAMLKLGRRCCRGCNCRTPFGIFFGPLNPVSAPYSVPAVNSRPEQVIRYLMIAIAVGLRDALGGAPISGLPLRWDAARLPARPLQQ